MIDVKSAECCDFELFLKAYRHFEVMGELAGDTFWFWHVRYPARQSGQTPYASCPIPPNANRPLAPEKWTDVLRRTLDPR